MALAAEVLGDRWTLLILTEMWWGSTRFNDIRRGVPGISPTLLSKRLKQLEAHGLVERVEDSASGTVEYIRTQAAIELEPIIEALGKWAYRNTDAQEQLLWLDPSFFMWNLRRSINIDALPRRRGSILRSSRAAARAGASSRRMWRPPVGALHQPPPARRLKPQHLH